MVTSGGAAGGVVTSGGAASGVVASDVVPSGMVSSGGLASCVLASSVVASGLVTSGGMQASPHRSSGKVYVPSSIVFTEYALLFLTHKIICFLTFI